MSNVQSQLMKILTILFIVIFIVICIFFIVICRHTLLAESEDFSHENRVRMYTILYTLYILYTLGEDVHDIGQDLQLLRILPDHHKQRSVVDTNYSNLIRLVENLKFKTRFFSYYYFLTELKLNTKTRKMINV